MRRIDRKPPLAGAVFCIGWIVGCGAAGDSPGVPANTQSTGGASEYSEGTVSPGPGTGGIVGGVGATDGKGASAGTSVGGANGNSALIGGTSNSVTGGTSGSTSSAGTAASSASVGTGGSSSGGTSGSTSAAGTGGRAAGVGTGGFSNTVGLSNTGGISGSSAGSDPRITTIAPIEGSSVNRSLHGPAAFFCGGMDDLLSCSGHEAAFDAVTEYPVMLANQLDATHGNWLSFGSSELNPFYVATTGWFRVHLMGDDALRSMFYGENCGLCQDTATWQIDRKMMD